MLIFKRLTVWLLETFFEIWLLGLAIVGLFGYDAHAFGRSLEFYACGLALFSFTTGYLFTTVIARGIWRNQKVWSYPIAATVLFLIHAQIFFVVSGGLMRSQRFKMRLAGCCVVFICTFLGSIVLRTWTHRLNPSSDDAVVG